MSIKGAGVPYRRKDGLWAATVELGYDGRGRRVRKVVTSKNRNKVIAKRRELIAKLEAGDTSRGADKLTVEGWMDHWLTDIVKERIRPHVWDTYASISRRHIVPALGAYKLKDLTPANVRELHGAVLGKGLSTRTAEVAHNVLAGALKDAKLEGVIRDNPAELTRRPQVKPNVRAAMTNAQAKQLLQSAADNGDPLASRWAAALLLGARKSELLGLTWDRVDLTRGTIDLSWQLQRIRWRHGCTPADNCAASAASRCRKREPDAPRGMELRHCTEGLYWTRPKTASSVRKLPIPAPLVAILTYHRDVTAVPNEYGLVWAREDGQPIPHIQDGKAWRDALATAGLPDIDLHSARHTTATLLLEAGVAPEIIAQILGHSTILSTKHYMHVDTEMAAAALGHLGSLVTLPGAPAQLTS